MLIGPQELASSYRRAKVVSVNGAILIQVLASTKLLSFKGLPDGVRLENAYYDCRSDTFKLVVTHDSFEPVLSGCLYPELDVIVTVHEGACCG